MYATEKAKAAGFTLKATDYRQPCPACSPTRRKKTDPCCHVTVTPGEIRACCFHCHEGWIFTDDDERQSRHTRSPRPGRTPPARQRPPRFY